MAKKTTRRDAPTQGTATASRKRALKLSKTTLRDLATGARQQRDIKGGVRWGRTQALDC